MKSAEAIGARPRRGGNTRAMVGLVASRGFVVGAGFLTSVLWTYGFDKETYGRYQIVMAAIGVVGSFCLPGLNDAALISSAKGRDGNLGGILRDRALVAVLGALALAGWGLVRFHGGDTTLELAFLFAALTFVPIQLQPIWEAFTNGKRKFRLLTIGLMLQAATSLATIGTFTLFHWTSEAMLPWMLLASLGITALVALLLVATLRGLRTNRDTEPSIVRYGHHVTVTSLFGWVFSSDRLIVGEMLSTPEVALLSVALILPAQAKVFFSAFEQVFLPRVTAAASLTEAWAYIRPRMSRLAIGYVSLGLLGFVLLPVVIPLFFSHRYVDAAPYAKWLWLSTCVTSPLVFLQSILNSQQDKKFLYIRNLASSIGTLVLFVVLIPRIGLAGAIAARIANHVGLVIFYVIYFRRALRLDAQRLAAAAGPAPAAPT